MSQHDYNIANQTFSATRTDLNDALGAVATNNAGNSAPSTTYANQWWFDSDGNTLYLRNKDNDAWCQVLTIGATSDLQTITTDLISEVTSGAGVTIDGLTIKDGGITATTGAIVFNEASADVDFRVESNGNANMLFVDGGNNLVGIGADPDLGAGLHIKSGDSGQGTANIHADELVVEGSANSGINILSGASSYGSLYFGDSGDSNAGEITYNHSSNYMAFATSGTERFRISSDGLAIGGTGAANSLDDYEEGTWTPTAWGSGSISSVVANYVKIGKLVTVNAKVVYGATASSDAGGFQNLPFTVENSEGSKGGNVVYANSGSAFYLIAIENSTRVVSYDLSGNTILNSGLSGDTVFFSASYYVA